MAGPYIERPVSVRLCEWVSIFGWLLSQGCMSVHTHTHTCSLEQSSNDWFFFQQYFCPLFIQIAQMGLIFPRWGLILPRIPPSTPVLYSAITHPSLGYVWTQNTNKPTHNSPFPGLNLKVGKMNYRLGNLDQNRSKCLKSWQNFSRSGQKEFFHSPAATHPRLWQQSILRISLSCQTRLATKPQDKNKGPSFPPSPRPAASAHHILFRQHALPPPPQNQVQSQRREVQAWGRKLSIQQRAPPPHSPGQIRSSQWLWKAQRSNSQSSSAPFCHRLRARSDVSGERSKEANSPSSSTNGSILCHRLQARSEVSDERHREAKSLPSRAPVCHHLRARWCQGPKSVVNGAKFPGQFQRFEESFHQALCKPSEHLTQCN